MENCSLNLGSGNYRLQSNTINASEDFLSINVHRLGNNITLVVNNQARTKHQWLETYCNSMYVLYRKQNAEKG